jgi:ribosomal protein S18 acetylase RimI-like enzyme
VTLALVPFPADLSTSLSLAEAALRTRLAPGEEIRDMFPPIASAIRSARATGGLLRSDGIARGVVLWETAGPLGVALRLLYLSPPNADRDGYRDALDRAEQAAGPIAFAPGPLAGLLPEEESELMRERGFAPFGRLEMAFPPTAAVPLAPAPPAGEVRPIRPTDAPQLARLHERAYHHHLDRYLALEDLDPVRDADRQVHDYLSGRFGELLSPGSTAVEVEGRILAVAIAVRRPAHALVVDVMTDPTVQGKGFGRAALASAVRALRERGETSIVLNVTEGNDRAVRLYSRVGFVRTMGPTKEWYDARRMTVELPPPVPR